MPRQDLFIGSCVRSSVVRPSSRHAPARIYPCTRRPGRCRSAPLPTVKSCQDRIDGFDRQYSSAAAIAAVELARLAKRPPRDHFHAVARANGIGRWRHHRPCAADSAAPVAEVRRMTQRVKNACEGRNANFGHRMKPARKAGRFPPSLPSRDSVCSTDFSYWRQSSGLTVHSTTPPYTRRSEEHRAFRLNERSSVLLPAEPGRVERVARRTRRALGELRNDRPLVCALPPSRRPNEFPRINDRFKQRTRPVRSQAARHWMGAPNEHAVRRRLAADGEVRGVRLGGHRQDFRLEDHSREWQRGEGNAGRRGSGIAEVRVAYADVGEQITLSV